MKISVIGTGYVGLVTGTCLADLGRTVVCVDNDLEKIETLNQNQAPFYEPGLAERIERNANAGRLSFSNDLAKAVAETDIIFIAVGTPPGADGQADLSAVFAVGQAVFDIYQNLDKHSFKVLVTKSTVPVGTGEKLISLRNHLNIKEENISIVSNPEFLREGTAIYDFFHPDRIVLGSSSNKALDLLTELYEPIYRNETPIVRTNIQTSELSKYASNAFLATKISFINEMSNLCELTGADVKDIAKIMGMDGRIGKYFLHPGPGYGGSCFPKDTQALIHTANELGYDLKVVKAVEAVNHDQKKRVMFYIKEYFGDLTNKKFALLGLSFKPNTDDIRDSSSLVILNELLELGAGVNVFDPEVKQLPAEFNGKNVQFVDNSYEAVEGVNGLILATEWNTFRELDLDKIKQLMRDPVFFDLRNVYSPQKLQEVGFDGYVIGRQLLKIKSKI